MSKLPAKARRAWWCQVGGHLVHWEDLRRQYREWCEPVGSNYLLYSSYNSSFWTCGATDAGEISMGPFGGFYSQISNSQPTTLTETGGSQTWTGTGTLRSTTAVDGSAWTSFVFKCVVGPYHNPAASPAYDCSIGICDSAGVVISTEKTITAETGMRELWFTKNISDIAAPSTLYFFITVTPASGEKWFADMFRLEKNQTQPLNFLQTTGASIDHSQPTLVSGFALVCPKHILPVHDRWDRSLPPPERIESIPTDANFRGQD